MSLNLKKTDLIINKIFNDRVPDSGLSKVISPCSVSVTEPHLEKIEREKDQERSQDSSQEKAVQCYALYRKDWTLFLSFFFFSRE